MSILFIGAIVFALHLMLKMHWAAVLVLFVFLLVMLPGHQRKYRLKKAQERRFSDASLYMDSLLYSFAKEHKIDAAMADVEASLPAGELKDLVGRAVDHIRLTFDDTDVMVDALAMIEEAYPCRRIRNIHAFMTHVEYYGGDIEQPVNLLLVDKAHWETRIRSAMQERKKMWTDIVLSVIVSLGICGIVMYFPIMNVDISKNVITQILTVIVIMLDDLILQKGQRMLAPDWLTLDEVGEDSYYQKKMENYQNYDEKKDKRLSLVLGGIGAVVTVFWVLEWNQWAALAGIASTLIFMNQHLIGRSMARRTLMRGIECAFPVWLMDLALLLQSENVHVALQKSMENVPSILRRELELLLDRLQLNPESGEPYHLFLRDFELPAVHSAMSMLFSLSIGSSSNANRQVGELIRRNEDMMDVAGQLRMKNKNSGMYLLFLAPVLTASLKLLVDMAVFMLSFLSASVV